MKITLKKCKFANYERTRHSSHTAAALDSKKDCHYSASQPWWRCNGFHPRIVPLFVKKQPPARSGFPQRSFPTFWPGCRARKPSKYSKKTKKNCTKVLEEAEIIFTLDFNALHRVGEMEKVLEKLEVPFVMIDHHQSPDDYAAVTYSDTAFGSTCEMLHNFICFLGKKIGDWQNYRHLYLYGNLDRFGLFSFSKNHRNNPQNHRRLDWFGCRKQRNPNPSLRQQLYGRLQLLGRALQNMEVLAES